MLDADVAIVGAGAAGLCLAHRLACPPPGLAPPGLVLLQAPEGPLRAPPRTWCFWEAGAGRFEEAVSASWGRLRVHDPRGAATVARVAPLRYKMIRSADLEALVARELAARPGAYACEAAVHAVRDVPGGAEVHARAGDGSPLLVRARWVFDSRPPRELPAARTTLLQHFHGWFLRSRRPAFDPDTVELMDFRAPPPPHGLAFGYVLPTGERTALAEYTVFSAARLPRSAYAHALRRYLREVLGLGEVLVTGEESGVIPMTDGRFAGRAGAAVFRIGTAGGATRPATGYTFAAVQRQTRALAAAVHAGRKPRLRAPHHARARVMDAVVLRALAAGRVEGAELFPRLFCRVPAERLLRFLDGRTTAREDLAVGLRMPLLPMLRTAAELPRLPRRPPAGPWPPPAPADPPPADPPTANPPTADQLPADDLPAGPAPAAPGEGAP
ncbi:lycopene cyclase family protein [Streptomyces hoynatensis]|uniref:lycopene cyclase family protein n=1 Tax=Streptomyces hoynatensis TaxID=1141874 RepID=UPI0018822BC3|nr:lycopene cyclase family protein [Streptomyces hoynatensis]